MLKHSTGRDTTGWRNVVRNFSPAWFTSTMGTGAIAILFHIFPYQARWLYWISIVVFCFEIVLFTSLSLITLLRFVLYPSQWSVMVNHPTQALFIAAWPIGLCQIIFMMIYVCSPVWGHWITHLAWAMWIFDTAVSILVILLVPFLHMKAKTQRELISITALEMFPFLACLVASGTGAVVATALPNSQHALATVIVSYVLLGISLPMCFIVTTIYSQRLILHKLPPKAVIVSVFLPLGPPCMAALAAIILGQVSLDIFPKTHTIHPMAGVVFYSLGILWAFLLWGFSCMWFGLAVITVFYTRRFEFNLGWWACTFPVVLFASVSVKMGETIPSKFFRIIGAVVGVIVILLWMVVSFMTIKGVVSGELFRIAPPPASVGKVDAAKSDLELAEELSKDE